MGRHHITRCHLCSQVSREEHAEFIRRHRAPSGARPQTSSISNSSTTSPSAMQTKADEEEAQRATAIPSTSTRQTRKAAVPPIVLALPQQRRQAARPDAAVVAPIPSQIQGAWAVRGGATRAPITAAQTVPATLGEKVGFDNQASPPSPDPAPRLATAPAPPRALRPPPVLTNITPKPAPPSPTSLCSPVLEAYPNPDKQLVTLLRMSMEPRN